jgi:hypothetical protein
MRTLIVISLACLSFCSHHRLAAQELQCRVDVVTKQVQTTNQSLFRSLERTVRQFMNDNDWTDKNLNPEEKIKCNLVINVSKLEGQQNFQASARIKSSRPVYGASYSTSVLNYFDEDFNFKYRENQNINYTQGTFSSNLSSLLAYYAYLIIGMDFDTFGPKGGSAQYKEAESIASVAQSSQFKGWEPRGDKSRVRFVNNLLSARFEGFRKALYQYHRKGLDRMYEETDKGRQQMLEALKKLEQIHETVPNSFLVRQFFEAKREEISNAFSKASSREKSQVMKILKKLDASNISQYKESIKE